jgi:hypothetical protein
MEEALEKSSSILLCEDPVVQVCLPSEHLHFLGEKDVDEGQKGLLTTSPTMRARVKIADASSNQVGSNQVPSATQPPPSHPAQVSMKWNDWKFKFSANVDPSLPSRASPVIAPARHGWSFYFHLPETTRRPQFVYFEITTASPILTQGWYVKMGGRVSPSPPGLDCRMYFQEVGDDLSGQGQRWQSTKPLIPSANRLGINFVQFVGLEPEFWSTVMGEPGNWSNFGIDEQGDASAAATAGFQHALANTQSIGIMCGAYVRGDPYAGGMIHDPYPGDDILTMDIAAVCDPFTDALSAKQENEACASPRAQQR